MEIRRHPGVSSVRRNGECGILGCMKTPAPTEVEFVPVVPVDDMTRAMLAYAQTPEGRAKINKARQQLRDGKGITVTPAYVKDLNRRISERANGEPSIEA